MNYGVIDIGSNTIVLIIYKLENTIPEVIYHKSFAAHLVNYIENQVMKEEGIQVACDTIKEYISILKEQQVDSYKAFITEPHRNIKNRSEFIQKLQNYGIDVCPLSGKEEAELDYLGSRIDTNWIHSAVAFDIGGGSTEFISFEQDKIQEACSIPIGCVRLCKEPIDQNITDSYVKEAINKYPKLQNGYSNTMIAIGGTSRATLNFYQNLYHTNDLKMECEKVEEMYQKLLQKDTSTIECMKNSIEKNRQSVYLPGLNMLISIIKIFNATQIYVSKGCVREGFLFTKF